jgi:rhodanese-related sulfurtransferase
MSMNKIEGKDIGSLGLTIFRDLPRENLDEIARAVEERVVPPNTAIFREGDPGDNFYIIRSGRVRVFKRNEAGMGRDLSILGPGDSFGEIALLTGEPRSADVEALEETSLMVLSKDRFDRILRDCPDISRIFLKEMRTWLVRDDELIDQEAEEAYKATRFSWLGFVLVIGLSILLALIFNRSNPNGIPLFPPFPDRGSIPAITPSALLEEYQKGDTVIVDAMPANFYEKRHIKGAINMPLPLFDIVYMMSFNDEDREKQIVVYGETVSKLYDLELAERLVVRGHKRVSILDGGLPAWEQKGYPVEEKARK